MKKISKTKLFFSVIISLVVITSIVQAKPQKLYSKIFDANKGELLKLKTDLGDIKITSWNSNTVEVVVFGKEKVNDYFDFIFEKRNKEVYVECDRTSSSWLNIFSSFDLSFEIRVPEEFDINLRTAGGDINIHEVNGMLDTKTSGGDIKISNCTGEKVFSTSGGDIEISNSYGIAQISTSGGDINVIDNNGDLKASTSGGDIRVKSTKGKISLSTSGGDIMIEHRGENDGIYAATSGGDVRVAVGKNVKANVKLKTSGGDAKCKHSNARADIIKNQKYEGTINEGGNLIECSSSGGDVILSEL
ncbi:MAG: DUF4097 domain-containing protein [Melioribacteraceae bacterium]|nr:DUF4097 domain-containing protein [Melioribacteraceae bacterium]MCO6473889.1 DUF4097 family beta strand repeat protein [Melioribacteraceae bacterium]MDD3558529.1 DUF4097 family beta strand repeat-containing protein [Melioribacteraceae bacterium]